MYNTYKEFKFNPGVGPVMAVLNLHFSKVPLLGVFGAVNIPRRNEGFVLCCRPSLCCMMWGWSHNARIELLKLSVQRASVYS